MILARWRLCDRNALRDVTPGLGMAVASQFGAKMRSHKLVEQNTRWIEATPNRAEQLRLGQSEDATGPGCPNWSVAESLLPACWWGICVGQQSP
jgi:hypothetical protein